MPKFPLYPNWGPHWNDNENGAVDNSSNSDSFFTTILSYKEFIMMKRLILCSVLTFCCLNLTAINMFNSMCNGVVSLGQSIDNTTVPVIGNLTNVLPFAMISAGLQKCPGQTIIVCAGLLSYILSHNESVCAQYNTFKDMIFTRLGIRRSRDKRQFDDTLFIFDGEDEEDAEEIMELEDEFLLEASEDDEYTDAFKHQRSVKNKKRNVKFI